MTTSTCLIRRRPPEQPSSDLPPRKPRRHWGFLPVLALATAVVFCHGCHRGDHDDEPGIFLFKARPAANDDKGTR